MTEFADQIDNIHNGMLTVALESGYFTSVNSHEPTSAPAGLDMFAAVWCQLIKPVPARSGLNKTSGMLIYNLRMYTNQMEDQDYIDPQMLRATSDLMRRYSGRFALGGLICAIDLLGAYDIPLSAVAGYLQLGTTKYRVMTLTIPMIVDNLFTQAP